MKYTEVRRAIDSRIRPMLFDAGFFQSSRRNWTRQNGYDINIIQLQKHSITNRFCINLGIHYSFLPKPGTESPWEADKMTLADCEIKLRLTVSPTDNDQWWSISEESVTQVSNLICEQGIQLFDAYHAEGALSSIDPKSIEIGNHGILAPITEVRACLLLARLHEQLRNRDRCVEAATIGLKLAGMAVGPKVELQEILKRNKH